jgi:MOSC domain-containing protein YiiM
MASGRLIRINRSNGGLPKLPVAEPLMLASDGIEGDRHRNLKYHGGPNKAVLMIAAELIDELAQRGYPVGYGALGENLTVSGLDPHLWRKGQRYRVGEDAVIELTTLRTPCDNLLRYGAAGSRPIAPELYDAGCKAGDTSSPHWAHGGFYARVIRGGLLAEGAPVTLESDLA